MPQERDPYLDEMAAYEKRKAEKDPFWKLKEELEFKRFEQRLRGGGVEFPWFIVLIALALLLIALSTSMSVI